MQVETLGKCGSFDEFQHERTGRAAIFQPVDMADVRVVQRREHLRLALKSRKTLRVAREEVGEDLDCDSALQLRVVGPIDLTDPARSKRAGDFVRTDPGFDGKGKDGSSEL